MSWTAGLNFASGQFSSEQRLNASSVNEYVGAFTVSIPSCSLRRLNVAGWTSGMKSISPSVSARSTASSLP